ncbi:hypothetical protein D3C76_1566170 [compost metagenome]
MAANPSAPISVKATPDRYMTTEPKFWNIQPPQNPAITPARPLAANVYTACPADLNGRGSSRVISFVPT